MTPQQGWQFRINTNRAKYETTPSPHSHGGRSAHLCIDVMAPLFPFPPHEFWETLCFEQLAGRQCVCNQCCGIDLWTWSAFHDFTWYRAWHVVVQKVQKVVTHGWLKKQYTTFLHNSSVKVHFTRYTTVLFGGLQIQHPVTSCPHIKTQANRFAWTSMS